MAEINKSPPSHQHSPPSHSGEAKACTADQLPDVCLEVGQGSGRSTMYVVAEAGFLIGTVPGCDLRLTGSSWPAVQCLIGRRPGGASIRRLSTNQTILVNGQSVTTSNLAHGDQIEVGSLQIVVHVQAPSSASVKILQGSIGAPKPQSTAAPKPQTSAAPISDKNRQQLEQQINEFREKVIRFEDERNRIDQEITKQRQQLAERDAELERRQKAFDAERAAIQQQHQLLNRERKAHEEQPHVADSQLKQREQALAKQEQEVAAQKQELAVLRQELADIRTELYDRYRERRDKMNALKESVNKAGLKVQARKRQLEAEIREWEKRSQSETGRRAELEAQAADLEQARQLLDEERRLHEARVAQLNDELKRQLAKCQEREQKLTSDRNALMQEQERHKDELLRFAKSQADLDHTRKQFDEREREIETRLEQVRNDTKDMESQVVQLDEWHTKLSAVGEKLAKQKAEQEQVSQQLAQRSIAIEGQQTALAALKSRLEKSREEILQQERQLAEQRLEQETNETKVHEQQEATENLRQQLDAEKSSLERERLTLKERAASLETATAQLRVNQQRLATEEQTIREQSKTLEASKAEQAEASSLLQAKMAEYDQLHKRAEAERENLRERGLLLAQAEQARETVQEQLRRRSEDLVNRQKLLQDQIAQHEAETATLQHQREQLEGLQKRQREELAAEHQLLEQRAAELDRTQTSLAARAAELEREQAKLEEAQSELAEESQDFLEQKGKLEGERRAIEEAAKRAKSEFETVKREVFALKQQLPELEIRAGTALERLTHGREQLREQIDEVHGHAGQCRDELESLRSQVQAEAERLQQQERGLRRGQEEQRLAVAAFRQQLIDWQGQIADMKRLMATDEVRPEQRQLQPPPHVRSAAADMVKLARPTEQVPQKEQRAAEKRVEAAGPLDDMREWYRGKFRDLAGIKAAVSSDEADSAEAEIQVPDTARNILSLTGDIDPMDRKLGDLLRSLKLIDAATLTGLYVEARRQRRSLRQILLGGGTVTLYQMALIEAGNLNGLTLGPVRVIDRMRATPREIVYRVFDPRRSCEAVLRILTEAAAQNTAHANDFRQCFTKAMISDPNITATWEVLTVAGRPAVLQELLKGLPSSDWPALTGAPGVWYRLLLQAAQALNTAHEAGLIHGHLQPTHLVLTEDGILKVCGFGESSWLMATEFTTDIAGDLRSLATVANAWCSSSRHRLPHAKTLPAGLQAVLDRMAAVGPNRILSATILLDELEKAAAQVPVNPEAWDRLLRHVKDNAAPMAMLRQSA